MTAVQAPFRHVRQVALTLGFVLAAALAVAGALPAHASAGIGAPAIWSDLPDYAPGETVTLNGDGWGIGEVVHIHVDDSTGSTWSRDVDATSDFLGNVTDQFVLPDWFVAVYTVTATGLSGTVTTTFTDGNVKFDVAPSGSRATFVETVYANTTTCASGAAVKGGFPKTLTNIDDDTVGVGNNESMRIDASATTTNAPIRSFQAWSSPDSPASPFTVISGTSNLSVCIPGFQSGTRNYRATYDNSAPVIGRNNPSVTVNEGQTASNTGTWSDANPVESVTLTASVGTVTKSGTNAGGTWSWSFNTTDGPTQSQTVTMTATDSTGLSTSATFALTVDNEAPTASFPATRTVNEGSSSSFAFTGQFDPSSADASAGFHYAYSCAGASLASATYAGSGTSSSVTCSFDDGPSSPAVRARIIDKDGGFTEYATDVAVDNVAPTATFSNTGPVDEGSSFSLSMSDGDDVSSADKAAKFEFAFDCGDGSGYGAFSASPALSDSANCATDDNGSRAVKAKIRDKDGGVREYTDTVAVNNVAPTASFGNDGPVDEGSSFTLSLSDADDVSPADEAAKFEFAFDCGDGAGYGPFTSTPELSASANCATDDNGSRSVKAKVRDKDGGVREYTDTVAVSNVAPTVSFAGGATSANEDKNGSELYSFSVSDPGNDGFTIKSGSPDCGTGGSFVAGSLATTATGGSFRCRYSDGPASPTVRMQVRDADEPAGSSTADSNIATRGVSVSNVAPTVNLSGPDTANEGEMKTYNFTVTDPGNDTFSYVSGTPTDYPSCGQYGELVGSPTVSDGSFQCRFPDGPNTTNVAVKIKDDDSSVSSPDLEQVDIISVAIANVAPSVTAAAGQSSDEGESHSFALGSFSDDGVDDSSWVVSVNWGDGSSLTSFTVSSMGSLGSKSHTYADGPATHTVMVTVKDKDNDIGSASFQVTVGNLDPSVTLDAGNDLSVGEGSTRTYSFSVTDPAGANDPITVDATSCDSPQGTKVAGSDSYSSGTNSGTFQCSFPDGPDSASVSVSVSDGDGGSDNDSQSVTVNNLDPTVTLSALNDLSVGEGSTHTYSFSVTDPAGANDPISVESTSCDPPHGVKVAGSDSFDGSSNAGSFQCSFPDGPDSVSVSVSASDDDFGSDSDSQGVTVNNLAPRVSLTGPNEASEGQTKTYSYAVTDPGQDIFSPAAGYLTCGAFGDVMSSSVSPSGGGFDCLFADGPKPTTVAIKVEDEDGAMSIADTEAVDIIDVLVANVAPSLTAPVNQTADEGTSKVFELGSFSDDGVNDAPWTVDVNWGDGSPAESFTTNEQGALSSSHTYGDNGTYTVSVKVTDKDEAASAEPAFEVTVSNVGPNLTAPANQTTDEGTGKVFDLGSFSDDGPNDGPWTVAVDWGDGVSGSFTTSSQGSLSGSHAYDDNGAYTVKVDVTDKDGGTSDEKTFQVMVANVAPTVTFNAPNAVDEGSSIPISLTSPDDVSSADRTADFTYAFDCGSGYGALSSDSTASCSTNDNGMWTIKGKIRDKDGGEREYTEQVTVENVPPSAAFTAPRSVDEGSNITVSLTDPSDPSSVDVAAAFTYAFDCGDGTGYDAFTPANSRSCPTSDNGTRTVRGTIRDKDGGEREYTKQVIVGNVAPQVTVTSPEFAKLYAKPGEVAMSASFTDPGNGDTHTCSFNWDDGTSTAGTVTESQGSGTCTGNHTHTAAGVYTIRVTIADDDGASTTVEWMVIVYDPSAGFVTGGGWLNVAPGSYPAQPTLAGRANFGFNSQYKRGATVPTGETEFQFQVGNFNFHSTKYNFLVVSGYKAQYKGTGEVNGVPGYSFRLTAYDGALMNPKGFDRFRIKVMDAAGIVVFDNRLGQSDDLDLADPQVIGGGSIVIHKA